MIYRATPRADAKKFARLDSSRYTSGSLKVLSAAAANSYFSFVVINVKDQYQADKVRRSIIDSLGYWSYFLQGQHILYNRLTRAADGRPQVR